eukprot:1726723-Pyramimonas_sp.AAC.1
MALYTLPHIAQYMYNTKSLHVKHYICKTLHGTTRANGDPTTQQLLFNRLAKKYNIHRIFVPWRCRGLRPPGAGPYCHTPRRLGDDSKGGPVTTRASRKSRNATRSSQPQSWSHGDGDFGENSLVLAQMRSPASQLLAQSVDDHAWVDPTAGPPGKRIAPPKIQREPPMPRPHH